MPWIACQEAEGSRLRLSRVGYVETRLAPYCRNADHELIDVLGIDTENARTVAVRGQSPFRDTSTQRPNTQAGALCGLCERLELTPARRWSIRDLYLTHAPESGCRRVRVSRIADVRGDVRAAGLIGSPIGPSSRVSWSFAYRGALRPGTTASATPVKSPSSTVRRQGPQPWR